MEDIVFALLAALSGLLFVRWLADPIRAIPTLGGPSLPILSLFTAVQFIRRGKELFAEGYNKHRNGAFKVALLDKWVVVLCGSRMIEEMKRCSDEDLSSRHGLVEMTQISYTASKEVVNEDMLGDIVKENLMRSLPHWLPDVMDEVRASVSVCMVGEDDAWGEINTIELMRKVMTQVTSRLYVGFPLCRDEEYLSIIRKYPSDFMKTLAIMSMVPRMLKPLVGSLVTSVPSNVHRTSPFLEPMIRQRRACMAEYGDDWSEKPQDMLQWLLDRMVPNGRSDSAVIERVLGAYFAGMYTAINSLAHALHHLAALPDVIEDLRSEAESILRFEGWTTAALGKLWKLDSFIKESQRYTGITDSALVKMAMKDVRLGDGTVIPKGTLVVAASGPVHHDEDIYPNANTFDPYRFSRERETAGKGPREQFTAASATYLPFGYGPHACPGRFYIALVMKAIIANMIINYDLKLGGDGSRPKDVCLAFAVNPAPDGTLVFRKRAGGRNAWP